MHRMLHQHTIQTNVLSGGSDEMKYENKEIDSENLMHENYKMFESF